MWRGKIHQDVVSMGIIYYTMSLSSASTLPEILLDVVVFFWSLNHDVTSFF